jgi:16S rRNA (cytidine1402-2'-O)-methyltransferase
MARELTKLYETILFCTLSELRDRLEAEPVQRKGEFVILIAGAVKGTQDLSAESERVLRILQDELPLKQACAIAARITGEKKNRLYRFALDQKKTDPANC